MAESCLRNRSWDRSKDGSSCCATENNEWTFQSAGRQVAWRKRTACPRIRCVMARTGHQVGGQRKAVCLQKGYCATPRWCQLRSTSLRCCQLRSVTPGWSFVPRRSWTRFLKELRETCNSAGLDVSANIQSTPELSFMLVSTSELVFNLVAGEANGVAGKYWRVARGALAYPESGPKIFACRGWNRGLQTARVSVLGMASVRVFRNKKVRRQYILLWDDLVDDAL